MNMACTVGIFLEKGRMFGLDGDRLTDFAVYCLSREGNPPKEKARQMVEEYLEREARKN